MDTQSHYLVFPPSFGEPLLSIGFPTGSDRLFSLPGDPTTVTRTTSHIRKAALGRCKKRQNVRGQGDSSRQTTTISVLPDDVLLEIFCFYKQDADSPYSHPWDWHLLVHVCRAWRQAVFASPLRLNLRIHCTPKTPVAKDLGIWPALPILIDFYYHSNQERRGDNNSEDNIITALEHVDRVCDVGLHVTGSELEKFSTAMQEPFPFLTNLGIVTEDGNAPALPSEFLGGSAPRLDGIYMDGIPFPALPTLLLSTSNLVSLDLNNIPQTGYISPEALVVGLAALPRLRHFFIEFQSATPRPDRVHTPPVTRTVLPALTHFRFKGASEYLEDLAARIDAPQLDRIKMYYLNQLVAFRVAQFAKFIDRSIGPKLTQYRTARANFFGNSVVFELYDGKNHDQCLTAWIVIYCHRIDWQVSHIAQVLSHLSGTMSNVVHLNLEDDPREDCQKDTDDVEWLYFLHQFPSVQNLNVSHKLARQVALALEGSTGETVAETLPSLDSIYLAGKPASSIEKFVAARRLSDRPVTIAEERT